MKLKTHFFTLVELIVSMAVFALLSMMVVQLFSATQKLWVSNLQKSEMSAEGRMALDFIANLLMSATTNSRYDTTYVGSDYFELRKDGTGPVGDTSRLYFVTKSTLPALVASSPDVNACFVGIQVVEIKDTNDPDDKCFVLVVGAKTSGNADDFDVRFPNNTTSGASGDLVTFFDTEKDKSFADIVSNNPHKVSRIATNVVDFQVRAYSASDQIREGDDSASSEKVDASQSSRPEAVEIELTLMDRRHYDDFINGTDEQRKTLRNQFARTFRRIVWLGGSTRTTDISESWEKR